MHALLHHEDFGTPTIPPQTTKLDSDTTQGIKDMSYPLLISFRAPTE